MKLFLLLSCVVVSCVVVSCVAATACPGPCWSNIAYSPALDDYFVRHAIWNCTPCTKAPGRCSYGSIWQPRGGCLRCIVNTPNTIMAPFQPAGCDNVQTMCAKGFYNDSLIHKDSQHYKDTQIYKDSQNYNVITGGCVPCSKTEVLCQQGSYPSCAAGCVPCTSPPLPSSGAYRYSRGFAYRDCADIATPDPSICAWFQTPQWDTGYCELICAQGYARVAGSECQKCKVQSECPLGWMAPFCGASVASSVASSAASAPTPLEYLQHAPLLASKC